MNSWPVFGWIWGLCLVTILGSLSARKYDRSTHLIGLLCALAAIGQVTSYELTQLVIGYDLYIPAGVIPFALCWLLLCAIVEKFGQREGHRAVLFATASQLLTLLTLAGFKLLPPGPSFAGTMEPSAWLQAPTSWIALSSLMGFITGANLCVALYHMLRVLTGDRHVWLRGFLGPFVGGCVEASVYLPLGLAGREAIGPFLLARILAYLFMAFISVPWLYAHRAVQGRRANP